jgi:ADP-ribose pyrophosphatase
MDFQELREIPVSSEPIYNGRILDVQRWQVTCPNGNPATREIVVHKGAAAVVPVYEDGTTLLVRQHRVAVDRVTLEIPAGKLDSVGEDPLDCAVRELEEETGLKAERMTLLTSLLTTPGFCTEKIGIYLAQGLSQGNTHPDEDEFLGLVRISLDDAIAMVMRGEIRDSKTICGLMMAREVISRQKEQA